MSYIQLPSGNYYKLADGQDAVSAMEQAQKDFPNEFPQPDLTLGQEIGHGIARGALGLLHTGEYGIPALFEGAMGDTDAAKQNLQQLQQAQQQTEQQYRPQYKSFSDVHGLGQFAGYAAENIAEQVPGLLTALIPGIGAESIATRMAMRPIAEKAAADAAAQGLAGDAASQAIAKSVQTAMADPAIQASVQAAGKTGMHVGTFLGAYATAAPDQLQNIYEQTGQVAPAAAMMFGAGTAALNSILPAHLTEALSPAAKIGLVGQVLEKSGMEPGLVRNVASQMLTDAGINAAAGAGSAALNTIAANVVNNNPQIFQSKDWQNVMHGAINGAIAGGAFGAVAGVMRPRTPPTEVKNVNQTSSANQATESGLIEPAGDKALQTPAITTAKPTTVKPTTSPEDIALQAHGIQEAGLERSELNEEPAQASLFPTEDFTHQGPATEDIEQPQIGKLTKKDAGAQKSLFPKTEKAYQGPRLPEDVVESQSRLKAAMADLFPEDQQKTEQPPVEAQAEESQPTVAPEQTAPIQEPATQAQTVNDILDQAGASKTAALRKRVGDLEVTPENADAIRSELGKYAKNPKVADDVKANLNDVLANHSILKLPEETAAPKEEPVAETQQPPAEEQTAAPTAEAEPTAEQPQAEAPVEQPTEQPQAEAPVEQPAKPKVEDTRLASPKEAWDDMKDEGAPEYDQLPVELKDQWDGAHDANTASPAFADRLTEAYNRQARTERINARARAKAPKEEAEEEPSQKTNKLSKEDQEFLDATSHHEVNDLAEEKTRNPSLSNKIKSLLKRFIKGEITGEEFANQAGFHYRYIKKLNQAKRLKAVKDRVRGQDILISKMRDAVRRGELPRGATEFAEWLIKQNPELVNDLGISVLASKENTPAGSYIPFTRVMKLFKDAAAHTTPVHEIMHHMERMMPADLQHELRGVWLKDLVRAAKESERSGTPEEKEFYKHLLDSYFGDGGDASYEKAMDLIKNGKVSAKKVYQHVNPSEFWAVNATRILKNKYNTSASIIGKIKNWMYGLYQKLRSAIGLDSDAPIMKALDSLIKGDGKFQSDAMLHEMGKGKAAEYNEPTLNQTIDDFQATAPSNIAKLPPYLQGAARAINKTFFSKLHEKALGVMLTEDVAQLAQKYIPSVANYIKVNQIKRATIRAYEDAMGHILPKFRSLSSATQKAVNQFIAESTYEGKWGYDSGIKGAKIDKAFEAKFDALPPEAQQVVKDVFTHGATMLKEKQAAIRAHIDDLFADRIKNANPSELAEIEAQKAAVLKQFKPVLDINNITPYAPLKRFGSYIVVAKSREYYEAEKNLDRKEIERLKSDENHYVVQFADTMGEAHAMRDELAQKGIYHVEEPFKRSEARDKLYGGSELHTAFAKFRRLMAANRADEAIDPAKQKLFDQLDEMVHEMYITSLADSSARKSQLTRERIAGYNQDMMRAFFTQGMADARYVANLKYNKDVLDSISEMQEQAKDNRAKANPYLNEFLAREAQSMQVRTPSFLDTANRMVGDWYLTFSPSFYLQQSLQTYTFSLPWMAARYGYFKSNSALMRTYGEVISLLRKTGINDNIDLNNLPKSITPAERAMLDNLVKSGLIDIGIETTMHGMRTEKGIFEPYTRVTDNLRSAVNKIEVLNRATTALATYRLALEKNGGADLAAQQAAYDAVRTTHGSYDGFNTPRLFNTGPIARSVTQFRRFQIIQLTMLAKQLHAAFKGESADVRAMGRKEALFLLGHSMILGGAKGLPYWAVGSAAYSIINGIFGDDKDQPKDFEAYLREHLGSSAQLLLEGVPAALGVDMSSKLGMGNVLSIAPYTNVDLTSSTGYAKTALAFTGPFFGGLLPNMADGVGLMAQGDYYKGLEKFMPNIVANSMKGYRFVNDGITNKNGDMVMSPEDIAFTDGLMQAVGLPPTKFTERSYRAEEAYKTNQYFQNTEKNIIHQYTQALHSGDYDSLAQARTDFLQLQNVRAANGFTRQPLNSLITAAQAQHKRERQIIGGVEATKQNKMFLRNLEQEGE